jgi:Kef-type K+ transport system membrane component KefB
MVINVITGFAANIVGGISSHLAHLSSSEVIIFELAFILILATVFAFIAKILRQPLIPAYVLTGLIIGPLVLGFINNIDLINAFSEIGIAFLLFTAGLEISFNKIKEANLKKIAIIGTLQIIGVFLIALFAGNYFNLSSVQAAYIGIVLAFSSTMVVVKLLSDKGELVTLHGRLVLGILLLQDLVAILAIIVLTAGGFAFLPISMAIAKLLGIVLFAFLLQKFVLNKLFKFAARSTELLFLSSLAVLFLFVILTHPEVSGLSIVIGAFIAGVSLANSPFKIELESRISPLRDFFSILFFVALGMQIVFSGISANLGLFIFMIAIAILAKPVILTLLLRITGYRPKTSFLTAISLSQLSEFSLIIGVMGVGLGVLSGEIFSAVILATIITMAMTTYFIEYKEKLYLLFRKPLKALNFLPTRENLEYKNHKDKTILLVGAHRMGGVLLKKLLKHKEDLTVIDYNPEIINALIKKKVSCIYGDLASPDMLERVHSDKLKLVISTVPGCEEGLHLLKKLRKNNKKVQIILTSGRISEAERLYEAGADYVIMPKIIAGEELMGLIHSGKADLKDAKKNHLRQIKDIHNILY